VRIAIVSSSAVRVPPEGYGGTERVLHYLTEGLVHEGHEVTLFATGDSQTHAELRALYPRPVWPLDHLAEIDHVGWALAEIAHDGGFDVMHLNHAAALAVARSVPVPVTYTMHHARDDATSRFYGHYPFVHFVAISERQRAREDVLPRMWTVHHGLDPADFPFVAEPEPAVVFIGRFAPVKAPHLAIDAAQLAGVPIRLAGNPHADEGEPYHTHEVVPRLSLPGVTWIGEVGGAAKNELLGRGVATLFPASWEEPFGLVMVESMLCGTPVIAFPRGAAREVIDEGVTGFLVRDVEEMAAAIPRARAIDRVRCRARASARFSAARMVRAYLRTYRAAVADGPGLGCSSRGGRRVTSFRAGAP